MHSAEQALTAGRLAQDVQRHDRRDGQDRQSVSRRDVPATRPAVSAAAGAGQSAQPRLSARHGRADRKRAAPKPATVSGPGGS